MKVIQLTAREEFTATAGVSGSKEANIGGKVKPRVGDD